MTWVSKRIGSRDTEVALVAFQVVEAGKFGTVAPLGEGEASLAKNGTLTLHASDLAAVGIKAYAIVLADRGTLRIGLRSVRDGEQQISMAATMVPRKNGADSGRRRVMVTRAVKQLGLDLEACCGRYGLVTHGEELLFITLAESRG